MRWPWRRRKGPKGASPQEIDAARKEAVVNAHAREARRAARSFQEEVAAVWASRRHP